MFILMSLRKYNELSYKNRVKGKELSSLTIGLIGMGNIAKEVVNILSSLNTNRNNNRNNKILYTSNSRHLEIENNPNISIKFVSKETLLKNSDIISLHIPLNDNNLNYINENEFSLMKNDAILINTARGKLVNKEALIKKIKENSNFIYASDVFEKEPPLEDNYDLLNFKNVLITPHIGFYTFEAMEKRAEIIFNKLFDYLKKNEN